jgi:hypothetical protein
MQNYTLSLQMMQKAIAAFNNITGSEASISTLGKIALSIGKSSIEKAAIQGRNCTEHEQEYAAADQSFRSGYHTIGFAIIQHIFDSCNTVIKGVTKA